MPLSNPPATLRQFDLSEPSVSISTKELLDAFLSGKSPKTIEAYRRDLEDFRAFTQSDNLPQTILLFIAQGLHQANHLALRYKTHLAEERKLQPTTVNRKLAALRSLSDMAYTLGMINWKVRVKNQKVSSASRDTRGPGNSAVQGLKEEIAKRSDPKGVRDRALFHLLYDLALRRAEVVFLDLADVDLSAGTLRVLGKGRLQKEVLTMPTTTRKILANWIAMRGSEPGPLFVNLHHDPGIRGKRLSPTSLYRIIRELGERTGQKVRPHGLRHTSISEAVRKAQAVGLDVTKVLQFSRHKDLKTLQVYIDQVENAQGKIAELVAG
ncbi:tyrosine-type recombinase/integrase [Desulfomonile tiedjei]|uniref:Site-specific recombinase XerD n=1 Tax=Desulfomonile tiedjei (strain ATCC 49306 / DSM 6799 / DCB-1) TaxID=706587 RepID=I4CFA1_DESTA|nr:tyrosine-type recombinase/integrase [Desulfomonile tiedjei]AFM28242.1 site-specific recombinase XerD [Desulfomonile tiedjei DSM 6799]